MIHIQNHPEELFVPLTAKIIEDFETLIDSLIFHILANAQADSNEEPNKIKSQDLLQLSNHAFDLITFLVGLNPLNPDQSPYQNNPNSPPATLAQ